MKPPFWISSAILAALCLPASADIIYSNLQDIAIPTDFTGVSVTVNGGTINPFFGGVGVANNNLFQPVRSGTGNLDTIQNLGVGSIIDASKLFSTGYGGSQDHLGNTFNVGQEGYLGFKTGAGNYGWMRVVFTNNTGGATIKDWAYDNSGAAVYVGRIEQGAAIGNAQLVTLSPGSGESFTLATPISDQGSVINSLLKTGAGSSTLTNATYTGSTTVSSGRLTLKDTTSYASSSAAVNGGTLEFDRSSGADWTVSATLSGSGNLEKTGAGTVVLTGASTGFTGITTVSNGTLRVNGTLGAAGSSLVVASTGTLGGNGLLGGDATINGTLAPGNSIDSLDIAGDLGLNGISDFEINAFDLTSDLVNVGQSITFGGILNVLNTSGTLSNGQVFNLFDWVGSSSGTFSTVNLPGLDSGLSWDTSNLYSNGTLTVIPEPKAALLGGLALLALLRRKR